ncbi:YqgE/AlgH family protein [Azospira restricta]|uniref:YqgE/AlgH family protein n=1 Tax=Azospira restricta TaxID=404405 RepID=A0A974SM62_9RHOO|nr:YqgE/AlgH family protein [Azospira restricta]QRJ62152.1 YqgE/AlgH family protein [Azospira restricta]
MIRPHFPVERRPWRRVAFAVFAMCCAFSAAAQVTAEALFLVATPQVRDSLFAESVVLVTRHGRSPPLGVIVNRPLPRDESEDRKSPGLYLGGPVATHRFAYLYRSKRAGLAEQMVLRLGKDMFFGIGAAIPAELQKDSLAVPRKLFRGFSSWAHGQLEQEIARGDWLVLPFDADVALRDDVNTLWQEMLSRASSRSI